MPSTKSQSQPTKGKRGRLAQVFWLTFLVASLAYAWYSFYAPSNRIAWVENFATAQQQAAESDKPILLFFTGKWCSPCQIMKRQVWADDQVMNVVNAALIPVTIDVDDPSAAETLSRYGIRATPTTILTDSNGNVLQWAQGGISKSNFLELLVKLDPASPPRLRSD